MAYFVLPGRGKRVYRLAIARRIVDATARGPRDRTGPGLARRRTRVLRRALRPSRRLQIGLGPWLRALPARLPDPALTAALAELDPYVRVAYVLLRIEGLPKYAVRDQLRELRVRDPWPVIDAACAVEIPVPRRAERFDPAHLRPVRTRSVLPLVTAAALTTALVGVLIHTGSGRPGGDAAPVLRLAAAPPSAWTRGARTLDAWPARGDLTGDRAFLRRAAAAWAAAGDGRRPGGGTAQLLYAGRAGGAPLALLRHGDRVARYAPPGLDVLAAGADPSAPIALGGGRYLLAPWDAAPRTLAGAALPVRDGVVAPAPARTPCGRGPLFHLGDRTLGYLGGPRAAVLTYHSPAYAPAGRPVPPARLGPGAVRIWNRLGCLEPPRARAVTAAMAWEFWSGTLPHGGASAGWFCTRTTYADGGGAGTSTLLAGRPRDTGACDARRPVSGTWWQAPSGRWYYLAAAASGLVPRARGPLGPATTAHRLLVARPQDRPNVPVALTAASR
ncbi:hypothetical protein [Actinomadura verrucosospora]|uniref:Uncharacterized protein n=1 Tax=Actinomadura verrucosospora TaxID=46165 RepID=A0A7D3VWM6_ACTVE|nr:hypothetical protein [Actinomadura verrucosospora]QKG20612.1 hypothetical protein ACTIVE_2250 [Actinomadura verrucosospora]